MNAHVVAFFIVGIFLSMTAILSVFLFAAVAQPANQAEDWSMKPATYQPMVMLTLRATPTGDAPAPKAGDLDVAA